MAIGPDLLFYLTIVLLVNQNELKVQLIIYNNKFFGVLF